jgi:protein-disulfide isomerase
MSMLFRVIVVILVLAAAYALFEIYRFSAMNYSVQSTKTEFVTQGPAKADVTMVEFLDYKCGFCRDMHPSIKEFLNTRKDVRYVARPIAVLGEESARLARLALAAGMQGKFWEMHDAFLTTDADIDDKFLRETAALYDIDYDKMIADADGDDVKKIFDDNVKDADNAAIYSTPTVVINRTFVSGSMERMPSAQDFIDIVDAQKK